jgi:hypothetical protein
LLSSRLTISAGEVGKLLGERWKELTDKDKKKYEDQAKIDKERYETEKAQYLAVSAHSHLSHSPPTD